MFRNVAEHVHPVEVRRGESRKGIWSTHANMYRQTVHWLVTIYMYIKKCIYYYIMRKRTKTVRENNIVSSSPVIGP